jgi:hypothetical protein
VTFCPRRSAVSGQNACCGLGCGSAVRRGLALISRRKGSWQKWIDQGLAGRVDLPPKRYACRSLAPGPRASHVVDHAVRDGALRNECQPRQARYKQLPNHVCFNPYRSRWLTSRGSNAARGLFSTVYQRAQAIPYHPTVATFNSLQSKSTWALYNTVC